MLKIKILKIILDDISISELLTFIKLGVRNNHKNIISNVNIKAINLACEYPWFRDFLN